MKITDVEALYLRLPEIKARTDSSQDALLIRITTDAGIIGWGEVDGCPWVIKAIVEAPMSHTLVTGLRQILIGEDPMEITRLWQKMYQATLYYGREGAVIQAMAGIDLALWDIKGKALRDAGLAGDRRPLPRPPARLRLEHDAVHARGQRRAGAQGQGRGLHRGQVRLGAVRQGRQDRLRHPGRDAQGRRQRFRPDARCRPGLGRDHDHPARPAVRAVRPVLDRGAAAAGRSRRLRQGQPAHRASGWPPARRNAPSRLPAPDRRGRHRPRPDRPDPLRPDPGAEDRRVRAPARHPGRQPQLHHRHQHRGLAALPGRGARTPWCSNTASSPRRSAGRWPATRSSSRMAACGCPRSRDSASSRTWRSSRSISCATEVAHQPRRRRR